MEYFKSGDLTIPRLGFGTWQLKDDDAVEAVKIALDTGYRHVDTAAIYENEEAVGKGLKDGGVARDEIFLTTKIWNEDIEKQRIADAADESLSRLGTDYVDLLLLHWPMTDRPVSEQVLELAEVKKAGKARAIGISNYNVSQLTEAISACPELACLQAEYHPELDQDPVLNVIRNSNMLFTAYSPLGRGDSLDKQVVKDIAEAHGRAPGQVLLRWLMQQPNVAAIPKATSREHIEQNFDIFDFDLSDDEMKKIFSLVEPDGRIIDPDWAPQWDTGVAA
ncbi:aldo/keto reductase [Aquisalinus flavus]|uniref:2,5-didehydrogluconate reductase n=1 Tax=Aquisalinus flavus TaxID=1526572 RepID=A0A8J2V1J3_9PROT|nr:aldo/keto reductase [Aquisalinus flavus]MBD0426427.1 aldo/keto reductase [Aquisalinus flavus]UNE48018.1 aldo/keto reductase [Aquisalinus flavus]GGD08004.1 2,5-didehydrogluconate reductase [Aquisalinus flavus]